MRYPKRFLCCIAFCALLTNPIHGGSSDWRFRNLAEMKRAVAQYSQSPRGLYYIIVRARRQGLEDNLCMLLREMREKQPDRAVLMAAYAFSQCLATGPYGSDFFKGPNTHLKTKLYDQMAEADFWRTASLKADSKTPEILLEAGVAMIHTGSVEHSDCSKGRELLIEAIKRDPKWADAHYWLGKCYEQMEGDAWCNRKYKESTQYARLGIIELEKAQRMEPQFHTSCLSPLISCYHQAQQWNKLLATIDEYVKITPDDGKGKIRGGLAQGSAGASESAEIAIPTECVTRRLLTLAGIERFRRAFFRRTKSGRRLPHRRGK